MGTERTREHTMDRRTRWGVEILDKREGTKCYED